MQEQFDAGLMAHVLRDQDNRVRAIRHSQEYWESEEGSRLAAAIAYLRAMAGEYEVPSSEMDNLQVRATHLDPKRQGVEYRLAEERQSFDSTTFGFDQTVLNTPVWAAGLKVTVKQGPNRVVRSSTPATCASRSRCRRQRPWSGTSGFSKRPTSFARGARPATNPGRRRRTRAARW